MTKPLFNYDYESEDSSKYGKFYWGIILQDGRHIYINADRMNVSDSGDLIALREIARPNEHDGEIQMTFSLARGQWLSFFAASVISGMPVCLDNSAKTEDN